MRILVSDYDGTLTSSWLVLRGDIVSAIRKWRDAGNLFGIATGRDFSMTISETERWGIPFDFLICINGATIHDRECALLRERLFDDGVVADLLNHPAGQASLHFQLSGVGPLRLHLREGSWFPKLGVAYEEVDFRIAEGLRDLGQVSFAFPDEEICTVWEKRLEKDMAGRIEVHRNVKTIDINPPGVDKATAIHELASRHGWGDHQIFTVGDGGNDAGMLARYTGYSIADGSKEATASAQACCRDIEDMMDMIQGKAAGCV